MTLCGRDLRNLSSDVGSMEDVAQQVVTYFYDRLLDGENGSHACPLVRFFNTQLFGQLDEKLQQFAQNMMPETPLHNNVNCLAMLATKGADAAWNDRNGSEGHQAIPLPSEDAVGQIPMIARLVHQLGIPVEQVIQPDTSLLLDDNEKEYGVFFVPDAQGSAYIPAQDFVEAHSIKSVIGFGGQLSTGNTFAVILFSRCKLSRQVADLFSSVALNVQIAVAPFTNRTFSD